MPAKQEGVSGVYYGWDPGESGFGGQMDANLLKLAAIAQIRVVARDTTMPPESPENGDCYIPALGAEAAWFEKDGQLAVYRSELPGWEFYEPRLGWVAYILSEGVLCAYKETGWSTGISI